MWLIKRQNTLFLGANLFAASIICWKLLCQYCQLGCAIVTLSFLRAHYQGTVFGLPHLFHERLTNIVATDCMCCRLASYHVNCCKLLLVMRNSRSLSIEELFYVTRIGVGGQIVVGQLNAYGREWVQSIRVLLGFTTAILKNARRPLAGHVTIDLFKIGQLTTMI